MYNIVVGSSEDVVQELATHTMENWTSAIEDYDKIIFLEGNHILTSAIDIEENYLIVEAESLNTNIILSSTNTLTFSGRNNRVNLNANRSDYVYGYEVNEIIINGVELIDSESSEIAYIVPQLIYPYIEGIEGDSTAFSELPSDGNGGKLYKGNSVFFTRIKGRKPITDPRIGMKMGNERFMFDSLILIKDEKGPQGESVWSVDGRDWARVYGDWTHTNDENGTYLSVVDETSNADYMEIVGYFDNINFLSATTDADRLGNKIRAEIDGITDNFDVTTGTTVSSPLEGRFLDATIVFPMYSGTLGLKTLHLSQATGSYALSDVSGLELNIEASALQVPDQLLSSQGTIYKVSSTTEDYHPDINATNYGTSEGYDGYFDTGLEAWQTDYLEVSHSLISHTSSTGYAPGGCSDTKLLALFDNEQVVDISRNNIQFTQEGVSKRGILPWGNSGNYRYITHGNEVLIATDEENDFSIGSTDDFSVDGWFNFDNVETWSVMETIFSLTPTGSNYGVVVYITASKQLSWYLSSNNSSWDIRNGESGTKADYKNNNWFHLALQRNNAAGTYDIYINGVLEMTITN
ncbi:MAG: LamG domain-containing protein, partial [Bacteroidetes bacterium]|nr:LamG domain-containing protein [Bacteroidota bacterium]